MSLVTRFPATPPEEPVLVITLEGWMDAGFAASTASTSLLGILETERLASFSSDELIDHRARRPRLLIHDGVRRRIRYAGPELFVGRDAAGAGVALLVGPEPDYRWKAFAAEVVSLAQELGTRLVVGFGAFPLASPHTRPVRLASTASDASYPRQVGFVPGRMEVPTGIADAIGLAASEAGIPSVCLWAGVPHYVAGMPYPAGTLALVEGLANLAGLTIPTDGLQQAAEDSRRRIDELIAQSDEHVEMVRQLETQSEELPIAPPAIGIAENEIPSGDEIAAELERYFRDESL